jgi:hypothetical protein
MNKKILLIGIILALLLFPVATNVAVNLVVPSFFNLPNMVFASSGASVLVGGGGDEIDTPAHPG